MSKFFYHWSFIRRKFILFVFYNMFQENIETGGSGVGGHYRSANISIEGDKNKLVGNLFFVKFVLSNRKNSRILSDKAIQAERLA